MTAEKKKNEVTQVKNVLYEQARQIAADKQSCEEDLAKAKPALDAAEAALSRISAKDIIGLKALKSPPRMVKVIFDGVLLLRQLPIKKCEMIVEKGTGYYNDSWKEHAIPMMNDMKLLDKLMHFPRDRITDETVELLYPYIEREDWNYKTAEKAAGNVAGLCDWVKAMCTYHNTAKVVGPKRDSLIKAEKSLDIANIKLKSALGELAECQAELDKMQVMQSSYRSSRPAGRRFFDGHYSAQRPSRGAACRSLRAVWRLMSCSALRCRPSSTPLRLRSNGSRMTLT